MAESNPKVDAFISREKKWPEEFKHLRSILLSFPLNEELKWGKPCYASQGSNVAIMQGFKEYCALLFTKGVLLNDPAQILIQQTELVQAEIINVGPGFSCGMDTRTSPFLLEKRSYQSRDQTPFMDCIQR